MASSRTWNFPFRAGDWWVWAGHVQGLLQSPCVILTAPYPPLPLVYFHFCCALKEQVPAPDSKETRNPATMNTAACTPVSLQLGGKEGDNWEMTGDHSHKPLSGFQPARPWVIILLGLKILPSDDPLCHLGIHPQNNCLCRSGSLKAQDIGPFTAWGTWEGGRSPGPQFPHWTTEENKALPHLCLRLVSKPVCSEGPHVCIRGSTQHRLWPVDIGPS